MRRKMFRLLPHVCAILLIAGSALAQAPLSRVVVYKSPTPGRPVGSPTPPFSPIVSSRPAELGFTQVADYVARTLYEGPAAAASQLVQSLGSSGYQARIATELDTVLFNDYRISADTGIAVPPIPPSSPGTGRDGLYILTLRGYSLKTWMDDLKARNVRLVEALPPAGYLVRGERVLMSTLKSQVTYLRGVFAVTPTMKKVLFGGSAPPPSPTRKVAIRTAEESPSESLTAHLRSLDPRLFERKESRRALYIAALADLDIENLTRFDFVYSISPLGEPKPSSERVGMLALAPVFNAGRQELPASIGDTNNYLALLQAKGITDFSNTVIGVVDTGFDNGIMSAAQGSVHPDFATPGVLECTRDLATDCDDRNRKHGTVTASTIAGYADFGPRWAGFRADNGSYRYGLGLAPRAKLIIERYIGCGVLNSLNVSLDRIQNHPTRSNVVNLSSNNAESGYDIDSRELDRRTRLQNWLFTVSAGNIQNADDPDPVDRFVRAPATAKNVIAVGATENWTTMYDEFGNPVGWPGHPPPTLLCRWSRYSPWGPPEGNFTPEDAQNVPRFSAQRRDPSTNMFKPDLVAPGVRVTGPVARVTDPVCFWSVFCNSEIDRFFVGTPEEFAYGHSAGTSWSAPAVAGAAAVVRKWFRNIRFTDPSPAMTKAMLINGARDIYGGLVRRGDFTTLAAVNHITYDPYQGFGSLNLERLLGNGANYFTHDQATELNQTTTFWEAALTVRDGTKPIRITLVYTDAPSAESATNYAVRNDLTFVAYQTACFPCWLGNNINSFTGDSVPNSFIRDTTNNVEVIIIPPGYYPTGSTVRLLVSADNLVADGLNPDNPGQPFRQDFDGVRGQP